MELTRKMFFKTAVDSLYREDSQQNCTYKEAIEKAEKIHGITHEQLITLCRDGVESIEI